MSHRAAKLNALFVIGAFAMLVVLLFVIVAPVMSGPKGMSLGPMSVGLAGLSGLSAIYCALRRLPPPGPLPSPGEFQVHLLIALAFAEPVMLFGTFLGSAPIGAWPFALATLAIMLGLILPKTLRYYQLLG